MSSDDGTWGIGFTFIQGVCLGIEFAEGAVCIDLLILRIVFLW